MKSTPRTLFLITIIVVLSSLSSTAYAQDYLSILDPRQSWYRYSGTIEEAVLSIKPKGIYMEYGLYLTFSARGAGYLPSDTLEVELYFTLPQDAIVTDSWLWMENQIIRATIMDQWTASSIYENIVRRRRDPSILFKRGPGNYELRVFPMGKNERRKVKITYLVPVQWSTQTASAPIPTNILRTSGSPLSALTIMTYPNETWKAPHIPEWPQAKFTEGTDPELGSFTKTVLPSQTLTGALSFGFASPMRDGVFLSRSSEGHEGLYQLAIMPSEAFDVVSSRKVAFLIDFDAAKTTVTEAELISNIRPQVLASLTPTDSFNVIVSRLDIKRASNEWLPADAASVEAAFNTISAKPLGGYSNLPVLLADGIEFINEQGSGGSLLLLSSSDQVGEPQVANRLIADLRDLDAELPPVHVLDFANENYSYHWIGWRSYIGNDYFYINLARLTGASYVNIRENGTFPQLLANAFDALGGTISAFDLYTTLQNGFCYGRFTSTDEQEAVYVNRSVTQVGKFLGAMPFVLEASGLHEHQPFTKRITISEEAITRSDSTLASYWTGRQISALEKILQTNDVISQIVEYSLTNRVLSLYTAFLALEPNQGGEVCYDCVDESNPTPIEDEDDVPEAGDVVLEAFPNPFSSHVTIQVTLPQSMNASEITVRVYNVMGQVVKTLHIEEAGLVNTLQLEWDGKNDSGEEVASGTYFVVVTTPSGRYTLTLVRIR